MNEMTDLTEDLLDPCISFNCLLLFNISIVVSVYFKLVMIDAVAIHSCPPITMLSSQQTGLNMFSISLCYKPVLRLSSSQATSNGVADITSKHTVSHFMVTTSG